MKRNDKGQYKKEQPGNPKGKPRGARHATTLAIQSLLEGEAELLGRKAIELVMAGGIQGLRLCLERIVPPLKERPIVGLELPAIESSWVTII